MKSRAARLALAVWIAAAAGCGGEAPPGGGPDAASPPLGGEADAILVAEVTDLLERYAAATAARDTAAIRSFILDDPRYVWFEEGEARYRSADDVLLSLAMFPPDQSLETTLHDIQVIPVGEDGAMAWSSYDTVVRDGGGVETFRFGGLILFVLERRAGVWRIVGGQAS